MSEKFYFFPLDPEDPGNDFLSYFECCSSLGVKPSVRRFLRYQELWGKAPIKIENSEGDQYDSHSGREWKRNFPN